MQGNKVIISPRDFVLVTLIEKRKERENIDNNNNTENRIFTMLDTSYSKCRIITPEK
jgi:hypothetical protein